MNNEGIFRVGTKAVIRNSQGNILLLHVNLETFKSPFPDHWDLPGGKINKEETLEDGLKREVEEEIGVKDLQIIKLIDASIAKMRLSYEDQGLVIFTYLCEIE